jgi:type IV pilus assembly protein PilB
MKLGFDSESLSSELKLFRGKGCDTCRGSGYKGRIGIYEFVPINGEIAALVALRAPLSDIKDAAIASGMRELRKDALVKILGGLTTPRRCCGCWATPKNFRRSERAISARHWEPVI